MAAGVAPFSCRSRVAAACLLFRICTSTSLKTHIHQARNEMATLSPPSLQHEDLRRLAMLRYVCWGPSTASHKSYTRPSNTPRRLLIPALTRAHAPSTCYAQVSSNRSTGAPPGVLGGPADPGLDEGDSRRSQQRYGECAASAVGASSGARLRFLHACPLYLMIMLTGMVAKMRWPGHQTQHLPPPFPVRSVVG